VDGEVIVTFLLNRVPHIVKRNSKTQEIALKIGDASFVRTTEQDVRNLFPVQAYSQKQLSSVGVRIEELKRFVEIPIKQKLDQLRSDTRDADAKIRTAYGHFVRKREIEAETAKYNLEITSLNQQFESLRKGLKGLSDADQEIIKRKSKFDNEALIIASLKNELNQAKTIVDSLSAAFQDERKEQGGTLEVQNVELITGIREKFSARFRQIKGHLTTLSGLFDEASLKEINDEIQKWDIVKAAFDKQYEDAKTRASANQEQLKQIQGIERRISDLNQLQMTNSNALTALGDPEGAYNEQRARWNELHNQKIEALDEQCKKFSVLSDGLIKADIKGSLDATLLKQSLKTAFASLNIQEQKIDQLCQHILAAEDPVAAWNGILAELEKLALHNTMGTDPMPQTGVMDGCGFIVTEKSRLAKGFDSARWLVLSVTELQFNPIFQYCTNVTTSEYIAFADASAGQQATALLTVLLNQPGAPLIIDQPEDDVDSKMIQEIVRQIWKAKTRRQLVFSSHNANFVVNGDAELVICCDYIRSGDQTGGQIKATGAIDIANIKDEITLVTEGGKDAFKLRKEKYGF
jgi:type III restriction enzyme